MFVPHKLLANPNLTPENFDWLRKTQAAADAKRDPPPVPMEIADKLRTFGFLTPNGLGGLQLQIEDAERCWNKTCGRRGPVNHLPTDPAIPD